MGGIALAHLPTQQPFKAPDLRGMRDELRLPMQGGDEAIGTACVLVGTACVLVGTACVLVGTACVLVGTACVLVGTACVLVGTACVLVGTACVLPTVARPPGTDCPAARLLDLYPPAVHHGDREATYRAGPLPVIIPIVRRTVTVRVRQVFHHPFQCDACQLHTTAHVMAEASGSATAAYIRPDESTARQRAFTNAQNFAWDTFTRCPCPRCGTHGPAPRAAVMAWEQKAIARTQLRGRVFVIGLVLTVLWAAGCGALVARDTTADGGAATGAVVAFFWIVAGVIASAIAYALLGPGKRPVLLPYIPQNVQFDPPPPGPYRAG